VLSAAPLETDIQDAWSKARSALPCANPDPQAVADLVAALRDCAERSHAIGFVDCERELLRMAHYLEGRITPAVYVRYGNDGLINPSPCSTPL